LKKNVEIVHYPSLIPYIIVGIVYVIGTFLLPMYKLYSYVILICLSVVIFVGLRKMKVFKDHEVEVEKPVVYESSELEEVCQLGYGQIETLTQLITKIDNKELVDHLKGIQETSEAILKLVEEDQSLLKKVRKYFHYYLAEIIRVVQQYDDLEEDPLNAENVRNSKEKIESTVMNAHQSFLKFYNDLYDGKTMDINVDLKVFDSMLKKLD